MRLSAVLSILVVFGAFAGPTTSVAQANDAAAEKLVSSFAALKGVEAEFREEKKIALLAVPLVNQGTVHFARPGLFARHTIKPEPSSIVIRGKMIETGTKKQNETLSTGQHPVLASFVQGYMGLLAGDLKALKKSYTMKYSEPSKGKWSIELVPKDKRLLAVITSIRMEGDGQKVSRMVITEGSGDVSDTTFSNVKTNRSYSAVEKKTVFSLR